MTPRSSLPLPLVGPRIAIEAGADTLFVRRRRDDARVGESTLEMRDGVPHIQRLEVDVGERRYGIGSEAARLITDALLQHVDRVTAWAPPDVGLAVYFWSRMGFRPVHGPGPGGGLLFERTRPSG